MLKIKNKDGWYKVAPKVEKIKENSEKIPQDIQEFGGAILLQKYGGSLPTMLSSVYEKYDWLPWKFGVTPRGFWEEKENCKKFLEWAEKELKINEKDGWYNVTYKVKFSEFFYLP
jgi:hypothetical protein